MPLRLGPTFAGALAAADRPLAGMWMCSGSPLVAEICAGSGLDWLLVDAEHSPNGLESVLAQVQVIHGYPIHTMVRLPVNDTVLIKQYLDLGVQNLLIPMVHSVADAEAAVAARASSVLVGGAAAERRRRRLVRRSAAAVVRALPVAVRRVGEGEAA